MVEQNKASRAKISLTNSLIVTGWLVDGIYFMSSTDATKVIEKRHKSIGQFLASKAAQFLPDKDKAPRSLADPEGKGSRIVLHTIEAVTRYWRYWDRRGNFEAGVIIDILASDSLERLYDVAFTGEQKSESEYQEHRDDKFAKLMASRLECKAVHPGFQLRCEKCHYRAWDVHNYMTLQISGMDATMARDLDAILEPGSEIGLDHYQIWHDQALRQLAYAKRSFTSMRTTELTWQEKVDKAVNKAKQKVKV